MPCWFLFLNFLLHFHFISLSSLRHTPRPRPHRSVLVIVITTYTCAQSTTQTFSQPIFSTTCTNMGLNSKQGFVWVGQVFWGWWKGKNFGFLDVRLLLLAERLGLGTLGLRDFVLLRVSCCLVAVLIIECPRRHTLRVFFFLTISYVSRCAFVISCRHVSVSIWFLDVLLGVK